MPKEESWKFGHLEAVDELPNGDPRLGPGLWQYAHSIDVNRQSRQWMRTVNWMENIFFGMGRHYIDDINLSRLSRDSDSGDLSLIRETTSAIPRPTNDILGRYLETNVALFTENRPRPRVTAKSDRRDDKIAAELSELALEYLWEKLDMPEKHREMARIMLYCGVAWLEVLYDPSIPRHMTVPQTQETPVTIAPGEEGRPITLPVNRTVAARDEKGRIKMQGKMEYGDITANVISPFEMHLPTCHWWNGPDMGWVMREYYTPLSALHDQWGGGKVSGLTTRRNGWYLENLKKVTGQNVQNLPLWWWERVTDMVEGSGPSIYAGTPEQWSGHTIVRIFDRKPNPRWPNGRTIIVAGDQVIYDSPKNVGARAFDPRWPERWHPYIRYRWEPQIGSIYGRSLVSKLLPKIKRVNAIDTTMIMWRRTVPIATWLVPRGAQPVEDIFSGKPGQFWEYDPRRTMQQEPKPIFPPNYPAAAVEERREQIAEMEAIAGTEEILRGQRPTGVNSAAMLDALRKQALASRSAILQGWDESLQKTGGAFLQEIVKHVKSDPRYAERMRILARERASRMSIEDFSGSDCSDNVIVRVDTASMAMVTKEARQARAIEFLQYLPNLLDAPLTLQQQILEELGFKDTLDPKGPDVNRAKSMISWIKTGRFDIVIPYPEDDPYVFHELLVNELKADSFLDMPPDQQGKLIEMIELYRQQVEILQQQELQMRIQMAQIETGNQAAIKEAGGAGGGGGAGGQ